MIHRYDVLKMTHKPATQAASQVVAFRNAYKATQSWKPLPHAAAWLTGFRTI